MISNFAMLYSSFKDNLKKTLKSHIVRNRAGEAKFMNLIEEQNAWVKHLRTELNEIVNLMPVDHGSFRIIEAEEADEWVE